MEIGELVLLNFEKKFQKQKLMCSVSVRLSNFPHYTFHEGLFFLSSSHHSHSDTKVHATQTDSVYPPTHTY